MTVTFIGCFFLLNKHSENGQIGKQITREQM